MRGLLVYTQEDAQVNRWFIGHLIDIAKEAGVELSLVIHNDGSDFHLADYDSVDFCINRSRLSIVNKVLEEKGIPCFNNFDTVNIANDKYKTYCLCRELSVPVMDTCLYSREAVECFGFPCVLKSVSGHGGSEVYWLESAEDLEELELSEEKQWILQKPASCTGVDVRIYVLGGKPVAAVRRSSSESFRSNYSLGGKAELFELHQEQLQAINALQSKLRTDYAGFDFILHQGHWVLNEIEDAVGARMLYSLTDTDIARDYMEYIINRLR
ncbi:MAG: hypothetical protein IJ298_10650 [Ruminococcus sp.]|nr:hypothetical protein [Ruminococcus sp.]